MRQLSTATNLTQQVAAAVRDAIGSGELRTGDLYSVQQIADRLDVSRTPVREALLGLADAGLVRFERNRGFRVIRHDPHQIAEIFAMRILLEVPSARVAPATSELATALEAEFASMREAAAAHDEPRFMAHDRTFHELVLAGAGNRTLLQTVDGLRDSILAVRASTVDASRSLAQVADEHEPIITAARAGHAAGMARALADHLERTGRLLLAQAVAETGIVAERTDEALIDAALAAVR